MFRDDTDLTGVALMDSIRHALDHSEYMIVVCTPNSAASGNVNAEVDYFAGLGKADRIIPVIIDKKPSYGSVDESYFPPRLLAAGCRPENAIVCAGSAGRGRVYRLLGLPDRDYLYRVEHIGLNSTRQPFSMKRLETERLDYNSNQNTPDARISKVRYYDGEGRLLFVKNYSLNLEIVDLTVSDDSPEPYYLPYDMSSPGTDGKNGFSCRIAQGYDDKGRLAAADSRIEAEIETFRRVCPGGMVISYVIGGVPNAGSPQDECFPFALCANQKEEAFAVSVQDPGRHHALLRVVATLSGLPLDVLTERSLANKRRVRMTFLEAGAVVLSFVFIW